MNKEGEREREKRKQACREIVKDGAIKERQKKESEEKNKVEG